MDNSKTLSLKKGEEKEPIDVSAELAELAELRAEKAAREEAAEKQKEFELKAATSVTINVPPAAGKGITLAGMQYLHGRTYQVSNDTKWALEEAQNRCWAHEHSLKESENKGRKQRRAYVAQ